MNRLHPHDLRAMMAAIITACPGVNTKQGIEAADHILAELEHKPSPIPSPGLEPPRPAGCPSCADAEAQVDRLKSALDEEARARQAAADGLADAKVERDHLVTLVRILAGLLDGIGDEERAALSMAAPYLPADSPAIRADDLVDALDDEPHRGFHEGHDTFEEVDGER